jgi:hypothetical protein
VVLKSDPHLRRFRKAPLAQIYVDLWNLGTWYADDFIREMDRRMEGMVKRTHG